MKEKFVSKAVDENRTGPLYTFLVWRLGARSLRLIIIIIIIIIIINNNNIY
jgi:hypothetical protein